MHMALGYRSGSTLGTALGLLVAAIALVGTQFYGWEWGDGRPVPAVIGVVVAVIAVALVARRALE